MSRPPHPPFSAETAAQKAVSLKTPGTPETLPASRWPIQTEHAGTRSNPGRDCRDAFLGLMKTCAKHTVRFWNYLGDRLEVPEAPAVPRLAELIRQSAPV